MTPLLLPNLLLYFMVWWVLHLDLFYQASVLRMHLSNQISSILNALPPQINNFLSGKMQTAAAPPSIIKTNANCLELFHSFQSSLLVYWPSMVWFILLLFYKQLHQMITIHQRGYAQFVWRIGAGIHLRCIWHWCWYCRKEWTSCHFWKQIITIQTCPQSHLLWSFGRTHIFVIIAASAIYICPPPSLSFPSLPGSPIKWQQYFIFDKVDC